ncbi:hypothetical protein [Streptomyces sp. HUAS ZL42]|uniref:hypothetical protein n=1 Tax=Streptomyces sp. HUAS ZL42 TaxID=3231715 RepID=UPI00345E4D84
MEQTPQPPPFEPPAGFGPGAVFVCTAAPPRGSPLLRNRRRRFGNDRARPDVVGFDETGMFARCDGRTPIQLPWRYVRRLDVGRIEYGRPFVEHPPGWLRLWVVSGVTVDGVKRLARWRRTSEGAVLLCPFGNGVDMAEVRETLRKLAPPGVRVGLGKEPTDRV